MPAQTPPDCRRAPGKPHHTFNLRQTENELKQRLIWADWWRAKELPGMQATGLRGCSPAISRVSVPPEWVAHGDRVRPKCVDRVRRKPIRRGHRADRFGGRSTSTICAG